MQYTEAELCGIAFFVGLTFLLYFVIPAVLPDAWEVAIKSYWLYGA